MNRQVPKLPLLLVLLLLAGVSFLFPRNGGTSQTDPAKAPRFVIERTEAAVEPEVSPLHSTSGDVQENGELANHPFAISSVRVPKPPSVWERLQNPKILQTSETVLQDGTVRRSRLVEMQGKYPFVVFEGMVPSGQRNAPDTLLIGATAKVADHLLVRPGAGVTIEEFKRTLEANGMQLEGNLSPHGAWLVRLPEPTLRAVDAGIGRLHDNRAVAFAEPDYLVYPSDLPSTGVAVEFQHGVPMRADAALPLNTPLTSAYIPIFDPQSSDQEKGELVELNSLGTRILTFDQPTFASGPGFYNPSLGEQNFVLSGQAGLVVQSAPNSIYPNNGSNYVWATIDPSTQLTLKHREGIPFTLTAVDLAEFSTEFQPTKSIKFTGYKATTGTVSQSFILDGTMDGTGPATDFQTFRFSSDFNNLSKVVISNDGYMIDNVAVAVEASETPTVTSLERPLLYDVTFGRPKHPVNKISGVGGPYAPTSVNFGTPTIRNTSALLDGAFLEFEGTGYQQVRFAINEQAASYRLEFDAILDLQKEFSLFFDSVDSAKVHAIHLKADGTIGLVENDSAVAISGTFPLKQRFHVAVDLNYQTGEWELLIDEVSLFKRTFVTGGWDLKDIRLHTSDTAKRKGWVDNIRIYAYGSRSNPINGPKLYASPSPLVFPATYLGAKSRGTVKLMNIGTERLDITNIVSPNSQFRILASNNVNLAPGGEYTMEVEFVPAVAGPASANLTVTSNNSPLGTVRIGVASSGVAAPEFIMGPLWLDVSAVSGSIGNKTFKLGNTGKNSLDWKMTTKGVATAPEEPQEPAILPNDPSFSTQWSLQSPTPTSGGIDAGRAWPLTMGQPETVIAVIDTGVDMDHPELQGAIWVNPNEIPGNEIDDDGNGFVDDIHGWDFGNDDADPTDVQGHGTQVAGIIAARTNNGVSMAGICSNARIMPLKFYSNYGSGYTSDAIKAISYATRMGASVSNNSWGGGSYSASLRDVIVEAGDAGSLFIASAGNLSSDNNQTPYYPASYDLENVVSVAATTPTDELASFSNYGSRSVDVAAPGTSILTLKPENAYATTSGTSVAAPHVAGIAGLLKSSQPALSAAAMKQILAFGGDWKQPLANKVISQGRVNAYKALTQEIPTWLETPELGGTIPEDESRMIPLIFNASSLPTGLYRQALSFTSNDPTLPSDLLTVALRVIPDDGYTRWLRDSFAYENLLENEIEDYEWSDLADIDGDQIPNLLEYVVGTHPAVADSQPLTWMARRESDTLFEFKARPNHDGVDYDIEWSETLDGTWRRDRLEIVSDTTEGMPDGMHLIGVKITGTPPPAAFFRLAVKRSPSEENR